MKDKRNAVKILGELETEVMEIIWSFEKPVSVLEVVKVLSKKRSIAYTTVMTIMVRLVEKGILTRKLAETSFLYQPKLSQEKFVAKSVHNIFNSAISNLGQEAVTHFAKELEKVSPKKRNKLLKILNI